MSIFTQCKDNKYIRMVDITWTEYFSIYSNLLEAVLIFVIINFMRYFRDWPVFLFEKDSCSYLTEKEGTGRPERTIQNF